MAHTPGPWTYQATAGDHDFSVYSETYQRGRDIALVRNFDEANARLIAAAPELLEACYRLVNCPDMNLDELGTESLEALDDAMSAIAKAVGGED